jgi:hypothetical protein
MVVIGCSMLINIGLKTWVFTKADTQPQYASMPMMPTALEKSGDVKTVESLVACSDKCSLTAEQKTQLDQWLKDYQDARNSEKLQNFFDYKTQQRQSTAAQAIAFILVGLPLYLYHWVVIKKDVKKNTEEA